MSVAPAAMQATATIVMQRFIHRITSLPAARAWPALWLLAFLSVLPAAHAAHFSSTENGLYGAAAEYCSLHQTRLQIAAVTDERSGAADPKPPLAALIAKLTIAADPPCSISLPAPQAVVPHATHLFLPSAQPRAPPGAVVAGHV